jgi:hypothetical protein
VKSPTIPVFPSSYALHSLANKSIVVPAHTLKSSFAVPSYTRTAVARMSVRNPYILLVVLAVAIALGLRQYLQTGNESKITDWVPAHDKTGEFKRGQSAFRNFISRESGAQFPPEKDRYHLYVSYACPWGTLNKALFFRRQD